MQIIVDKLIYLWYNSSVNNILHGGVAQLGERLNGIQEVIGSIPTVSTKNDKLYQKLVVFTFYLFTFHYSLPSILKRNEIYNQQQRNDIFSFP